MQAKIFSYKVDGVALEEANGHLMVSRSFDRKEIIERLRQVIGAENFKLDEGTLDYKIVEGQLYIEGLAIENQEPKTIGFLSGKVNS